MDVSRGLCRRAGEGRRAVTHDPVSIRSASTDDFAVTRALVDAAFLPEDVVTFLDALRADRCILGEWVAERGAEIVGHIVFSRVWVDESSGSRRDAVMLTPLAVVPGRQRTGIGQRLMTHALAELEARGEELFFVLGHPAYYPRAGFRSVHPEEVGSPWPGDPAFMIRGAVTPGGNLVMPQVIADAH